VTVDAADISGFERVGRAAVEFRRHRRVTDYAVVVLVILDKIFIRIRMNSVTFGAANLQPAVRVRFHHIHLMWSYMAAAAELNLPIEFQLCGSLNVVSRRVIDMLSPSVMATYAPD
jgi:hypothetical protein